MESKITLGDIKKILTEKTVSYSMNHLERKEFGLDVWHVSALEYAGNDSLRKRNYRVFSQGIDDTSPARWDDIQKPSFTPLTTRSVSKSSPTFTELLQNKISKMITDGKIKFAETLSVDERNKRAKLQIVTSSNAEKRILVYEEDSDFKIEEITT